MPTKARREDFFIKLFISAYENDAWADADLCWLDQKIDGAVEVIATRESDGHTLAIEHTLLQPFVGDKRDFKQFEPVFPAIKDDQSLVLPERYTRVYVPVGILDGQKKPAARAALANALRDWLRINRLSIPDGTSKHRCPVPEMPGNPAYEMPLTVKVSRLRAGAPGSLQIGRQQMRNDFSEVMKGALSRKLPKLVATPATKRILIFERDHINFVPDQIWDELERQRPSFPDLAKVDEIWILETVLYHPGGNFQLDLYKNGKLTDSLQFQGETLIGRAEHGWPLPI